MLVVALLATAAATAGPAYFSAAKTSIVRDTVASSPYAGHGYEAVQTGSVAGTLDTFVADVRGDLVDELGGSAVEQRLFQAPIAALQATAFLPSPAEAVPLAWRSDVCVHLRIRGVCAAAAGQVLISSSLAATNGWRIGQRIGFAPWGTLTVTGIYAPPDTSLDYWFGQGSTYFPYENPVASSGRGASVSAYDAMFTPRATVESAPSGTQGTDVVDDLLNGSSLSATDVNGLDTAMTDLTDNSDLSARQILVTTEISNTLSTVKAAWSSVAIPILLVTLQLLGLAWLLLFLVVTDAIEARGPEVALAKLRGHGRTRTILFGVSEPLTILLICLPLGALVGWAATALLARSLLRAGTPVGLPNVAWAAAGAATLGGLVAVGLGAQQTLRRPIDEQWHRTRRRATDRGWVIDAILLSTAAAGLLELTLTGQVSSARHGALSLLVPGLLGLAVAVAASRLLPIACRMVARRGFGGLATFLAVRHVARRPGGSRTTIILATSLALATFALAAWVVSRDNDRLVADTQVGASTVLTVTTPPGQDLGALVNRADPSGHQAVAVEEYSSSGTTTLAVDPSRFAQVASWRPQFAASPLATLAASLDPPAPAAVTVAGDALRLSVTVTSLVPPETDLQADVVTLRGTGSTPVDLGLLPRSGMVTMTGELAGCPCTIEDLTLVPNPGVGGSNVTGTLTFRAMQVHRQQGWTDVSDAFTSPGRWAAAAHHDPPDEIQTGPGGLRWRFDTGGTQDPTLVSVNRPRPLPAMVAAPLLQSGSGGLDVTGLDGQSLPVRVLAAIRAVPGAPADGVIVDRHYAELAAGGNLSNAVQQVWISQADTAQTESALRAVGIAVHSAQSADTVDAVLRRQGPGLAGTLFLTEAVTAAVLAACGAILGLYLSARRRRYEYAALVASGLSRRTLFMALVAEQSVVLAFATVVGIATGVVGAVLALPDVPEFLTTPQAPPLRFFPPTLDLIALLAVALVALLTATILASAALIRGVHLEALREAPA
jgi:putative ABC transport system permease protein